MKGTWIKVVEYASMPYQGFSRKLRKGYSIEFNNDGKAYEGDIVFDIHEAFLRVFMENDVETVNLYLDWEKIISVRTVSKK